MANFGKVVSLLSSALAELKGLEKQYSNPKLDALLKVLNGGKGSSGRGRPPGRPKLKTDATKKEKPETITLTNGERDYLVSLAHEQAKEKGLTNPKQLKDNKCDITLELRKAILSGKVAKDTIIRTPSILKLLAFLGIASIAKFREDLPAKIKSA